MGTLNLTSLIGEIQRYHANRDDLTDQIVIDKLNLVQERLTRLWGWEELERLFDTNLVITSVDEDDKFLTFPSNMKEVLSLRLITTTGESRALDELSQKQFDELIPEPEFHARGKPSLYTLHNNIAELWKVPDIAYRMIMRTSDWPTAFSASDGAAKSDFDKKDDILIYWTVSMIWDEKGEYERAKRFFGIAADMTDKAKDEQETKPNRVIRPLSESNLSGFPGKYWADPFIRHLR